MALDKSDSNQNRTRNNHSLLVAAINGNKDALLSSLDSGAAVDEMDSFRMTPLMQRCDQRSLGLRAIADRTWRRCAQDVR